MGSFGKGARRSLGGGGNAPCSRTNSLYPASIGSACLATGGKADLPYRVPFNRRDVEFWGRCKKVQNLASRSWCRGGFATKIRHKFTNSFHRTNA